MVASTGCHKQEPCKWSTVSHGQAVSALHAPLWQWLVSHLSIQGFVTIPSTTKSKVCITNQVNCSEAGASSLMRVCIRFICCMRLSLLSMTSRLQPHLPLAAQHTLGLVKNLHSSIRDCSSNIKINGWAQSQPCSGRYYGTTHASVD